MYEFRSSIKAIQQLTPGKIVCVGRNYAEHAKELGNDVPSQPVLFMKPKSALCDWASGFSVPNGRGECHHELELAVVITKPLKNASSSECQQAIGGMALALDLTLRQVQSELKQRGLPWELAKAFDGACPVSEWIQPVSDWSSLSLELSVNQQVRQSGNTSQMIWPTLELLSTISQYFTLEPGDIVLTGTPAGVAPLVEGDRVVGQLGQLLTVTGVVSRD